MHRHRKEAGGGAAGKKHADGSLKKKKKSIKKEDFWDGLDGQCLAHATGSIKCAAPMFQWKLFWHAVLEQSNAWPWFTHHNLCIPNMKSLKGNVLFTRRMEACGCWGGLPARC